MDQDIRLRAISHIQEEASKLWDNQDIRLLIGSVPQQQDLVKADWNAIAGAVSTDFNLFSSASGIHDPSVSHRIEVGLCIGTARRAVAEGTDPMDTANRTRMEREFWPISEWRSGSLLKPVMTLPDYARVLQHLVLHEKIDGLVEAWEAADRCGDDNARGENYNQIEKLAAAIKLRFGHWNGAKFAHVSSAALRGEIDPFDLSNSKSGLLKLDQQTLGLGIII